MNPSIAASYPEKWFRNMDVTLLGAIRVMLDPERITQLYADTFAKIGLTGISFLYSALDHAY
jgi:hypothetical protein